MSIDVRGIVAFVAFFELVNVASGNLVGDYDSIEDALTDVRAALASSGRQSLAAIALVSVSDDGRRVILCEGEDLATRARTYESNQAVAVPAARVTRSETTEARFGPKRSVRPAQLGSGWLSSSSSQTRLVHIPQATVSES